MSDQTESIKSLQKQALVRLTEHQARANLPKLVPHLQVPKRSIYTPQGFTALIHSIAHIEYNAIRLALDAVVRFDGMPQHFYAQWTQVADEEQKHFNLLQALLQDLGSDYGACVAHEGLWHMCEATKDDIVARIALVPRTLEARGLDATPLIQAKLRKLNTPLALRAHDILDIILHDEVGHVAIGNDWYRWLCSKDGLDPIAHYKQLVVQYDAPKLKPPLNLEARLRAGFVLEELTASA